MILILADPSDPWGIALSRRLVQRGERWVSRPSDLREPVPVLTPEPLEDYSADLTGVFRGMSRPFSDDVPAMQSSPVDLSACDWFAQLNATPCRVVNRPVPGEHLSRSVGSPAWEAVVLAYGLQSPRFYLAGNREEAMFCLNAWGGMVYITPQGSEQGGLVLSAEESPAYVRTFEADRPLLVAPVSIGQLVSVFVVGGTVAATVVRSGRWIDSTRTVAHLGSSLLTRCSELAQSLELSFAECLLVTGVDGQVTCFDVIGAPNYWSCPRDAQPHVVNQLAAYLSGGNPSTSIEPGSKIDRESVPSSFVNVGDPEIR